MNSALRQNCRVDMPERMLRSDSHSENFASSAELASTDCIDLITTRMISPVNTIQIPCSESSCASSLMPPIDSSKDLTVRL